MRIYKYLEFLLEGSTPEDYILDSLSKIRKKIEQAFGEDGDEEVKKIGDFQKYNLKFDGFEEPSNYNYSRKNLKVKFSDDNNLYILNISMNLEDAISKDKEKDFQTSDIKKCYVTFKKYNDKDGKFDVDEQLLNRTVDPVSIDGDFILKLKVDLDEGKDPNQEEEFKIETSDNLPEEETNDTGEGGSAPQSSTSQASIQNSPQSQNQPAPSQGATL